MEDTATELIVTPTSKKSNVPKLFKGKQEFILILAVIFILIIALLTFYIKTIFSAFVIEDSSSKYSIQFNGSVNYLKFYVRAYKMDLFKKGGAFQWSSEGFTPNTINKVVFTFVDQKQNSDFFVAERGDPLLASSSLDIKDRVAYFNINFDSEVLNSYDEEKRLRLTNLYIARRLTDITIRSKQEEYISFLKSEGQEFLEKPLNEITYFTLKEE